jgi:hypothetical protein
MNLESKTALGFQTTLERHMGTWTKKLRNPALVAGVLAITLAASPGFAKSPAESGSKRGGAGFASGAIVGGAAAGPLGAVVGGAVGALMGERSQKKSEALAARRTEAALLAGELDTLSAELSTIEPRPVRGGDRGGSTGPDSGSRRKRMHAEGGLRVPSFRRPREVAALVP